MRNHKLNTFFPAVLKVNGDSCLVNGKGPGGLQRHIPGLLEPYRRKFEAYLIIQSNLRSHDVERYREITIVNA